MAVITETSTGRSLLLGEGAQKEKRQRDGTEPERQKVNPYRPREHERAMIMLTNREVEDLRKLYSETVVHDFGDMYHKTSEERKHDNEFYGLFQTISRVKTKYRKLDDYVVACRKILYVMKEIAKNNKVMDPDKFLKKVLSGKITLYGVNFPKLLMPKKKRKELNWELISEYILNEDLNPKDLVRPKDQPHDWTQVPDDPDAAMMKYFGTSYKEYVKGIRKITDEVDFDRVETLEGENVMIPLSRLDFLRITKDNKEFGALLKERVLKFRKFAAAERKMRSGLYDEDAYQGTVFSVTYDDINTIRDMDEERNLLKRCKAKKYEFSGSFLNDDSVEKFMFDAEEKLRNKEKVTTSYGGKESMSVAQYEEEKLREELERSGWNIRKLYGIGEKEKRMKKNVKKEAKRLKRIKKALTEADARKKTKIVGFDVKKAKDEGVNSDKKKKSKKQKKKDKKQMKKMEQYMLFESAFDDFKEYEKNMLDFDD